MENLDHINTLAELLEITVNDMEYTKKSEDYIFGVETWHEPLANKCVVCVAGSVIAGTLAGGIKERLSPLDFGSKTFCLLVSLNELRSLHIFRVYSYLSEHIDISESDIRELLKGIDKILLMRGDLSTWKKLARKAKKMGV